LTEITYNGSIVLILLRQTCYVSVLGALSYAFVFDILTTYLIKGTFT